ncbi:MAG: DUF2813 domain-containing protein [Betaproteobacteria bacterium]|nr:DUF2813 domain-containing protein [Betaproteobacteria bacterium]
MRLSGILIENFRGIRRLQFELEPTTLLIGENEVGKSAVLGALKLLLGAWPAGVPPLRASDHHQPIVGEARGALRVELLCAEAYIDEWSEPGNAVLAAASGMMPDGLRGFALGFAAPHGSQHGQWHVRPYRQNEREAPRPLIELVRQRCPLLRIDSGDLEGLGEAIEPTGRDRLRAAAGRYWTRVANGETDEHRVEDPLEQAGLDHAAYILRRCLPHFAADATTADARIAEALGHGDPPLSPAGSAARKLAILMVAAALSPDGGSAGLQPGTEPVLLIEDPESHLHPITLAALWSLLEAIRLQKLVTTQSGSLLAAAPLAALRRLVRYRGEVRAFRVRTERFQMEELRKFSYHLRVRNGIATFARVWLLVEGETEFWALPELAHILGYDFAQEGIACVEFAQCGLPPLIKMANELGIQWHVLADGDRAGHAYAQSARARLADDRIEERLTLLREQDIEHCFWEAGFARVYQSEAGLMPKTEFKPHRVIARAIRRRSKPYLAFAVLASVAEQGPASVPRALAGMIETCVRLAREAPKRALEQTLANDSDPGLIAPKRRRSVTKA